MEQKQQTQLNTDSVLTAAETRIASGYVSGMIGKEIADRCGLSYNTVVRHTQNIYDKTGIQRSTNALVAWFLSRNYDLDLGEFRRRLGGFALFLLVTIQVAAGDQGNSPVRVLRARRVEVRKGGARRTREEEDTYVYDPFDN